LLVQAEVDREWRDLARLETPDGDLRRFLLLSLRAYLAENRRKRVWVKRGPIYRGVLTALRAPVLGRTAEENLAGVARLMQETRARLPDPDWLDHSQIEQSLRETDREIDALVYQLYGLTEAEIAVVER
ncbi:MAG: hypothetical protein HY784_04420, partial [Chloroflexi bacterium]|nr:hypothetical protein [Chloroflexota bacterium]